MTCPVTGKLQYATAAAAQKAMRGFRRNKHRSEKATSAGWHSGGTETYRCPHCHQFHIGHKTPRDKRSA